MGSTKFTDLSVTQHIRLFKIFKMKFSTSALIAVLAASANADSGPLCKVHTPSPNTCQQVCNLTTDCQAFSWSKSHKICLLKAATGWNARVNSDNVSGTRTGIVDNVGYFGGDLDCRF